MPATPRQRVTQDPCHVTVAADRHGDRDSDAPVTAAVTVLPGPTGSPAGPFALKPKSCCAAASLLEKFRVKCQADDDPY